LWIDDEDGIYFTDPRYGNKEELEQNGMHVSVEAFLKQEPFLKMQILVIKRNTSLRVEMR
jgi:hypothetical protein